MLSKKMKIFIIIDCIIMILFTIFYIIKPIYYRDKNPYSQKNYSPGAFYVYDGSNLKDLRRLVKDRSVSYNLKKASGSEKNEIINNLDTEKRYFCLLDDHTEILLIIDEPEFKELFPETYKTLVMYDIDTVLPSTKLFLKNTKFEGVFEE